MDEEISWSSFLMMLSSEKTWAYWDRLRLPIERHKYPETINFARGCLEIIFYRYIVSESEIKTIDFQDSWKLYRQTNPVFTDEFLENNQPKIKNWIDDEDFENISDIVKNELKFDEAEKLYEWGLNYFRSCFDPIIESAQIIRYLIDEEIKTDETKKSSQLFERILKFSNHIKWRNSSLERHFAVAKEVHQMTLPNEFEMVLQDCFFEGCRHCYHYAELVQLNLEYVNFVERWQELKADIGADNTKFLIDKLEASLTTLPNQFGQLKMKDLERLKRL